MTPSFSLPGPLGCAPLSKSTAPGVVTNPPSVRLVVIPLRAALLVTCSTIFSLAPKNLKQFTSHGSGILCLAIVGGALLPLLQGFLADTIGLTASFAMPIVCFIYIAYYGFSGSRVASDSH